MGSWRAKMLCVLSKWKVIYLCCDDLASHQQSTVGAVEVATQFLRYFNCPNLCYIYIYTMIDMIDINVLTVAINITYYCRI